MWEKQFVEAFVMDVDVVKALCDKKNSLMKVGVSGVQRFKSLIVLLDAIHTVIHDDKVSYC